MGSRGKKFVAEAAHFWPIFSLFSLYYSTTPLYTTMLRRSNAKISREGLVLNMVRFKAEIAVE